MELTFGTESRENLNTVNAILQRVTERALSYGVLDFSVIEGHRPVERQRELFRQGKTKIDGVTTLGKHNSKPSNAEDLLPYPHEINGVNVWEDRQRFCVLAGLMYAAAAEDAVEHPEDWTDVYLRWGGDWDGDGNNADSSFHDLPHFELAARAGK